MHNKISTGVCKKRNFLLAVGIRRRICLNFFKKYLFSGYMLFQRKKNVRGFTLIDALIGIFILAVGILSVAQLAVQNLSESQSTLKSITAMGLAQEGVELMRIHRNDNFLQGKDPFVDIQDAYVSTNPGLVGTITGAYVAHPIINSATGKLDVYLRGPGMDCPNYLVSAGPCSNEMPTGTADTWMRVRQKSGAPLTKHLRQLASFPSPPDMSVVNVSGYYIWFKRAIYVQNFCPSDLPSGTCDVNTTSTVPARIIYSVVFYGVPTFPNDPSKVFNGWPKVGSIEELCTPRYLCVYAKAVLQ